MEVIPGKTCPECGTPFELNPGKPTSTKVYGRNYRFRNQLNRVMKCANCGNIFSWNVKEE